MDKTIEFQSFPTSEEFSAAIGDLPPAYSVEIRQGMKRSPGGLYSFPYPYHEFFDCDTIEELYDLLCEDYHPSLSRREPFTVIIESVGVDSQDDHPSLTASERNPSLR